MIARLGSSDLSAYTALRKQAVQTDPLAFFATPEQLERWIPSQFHAELNTHLSEPFGSYGFFEDGELVAYTSLLPHPSGGLLQNLYVASSHRRKGIAKELMLLMMKKRDDHHLPALQLSVTSANEPAIALYTSLGFREVKRHHGALRRGAMLLDEVMMVYGTT